jgi:hypothetical protein
MEEEGVRIQRQEVPAESCDLVRNRANYYRGISIEQYNTP